jgi:hypothetical protein
VAGPVGLAVLRVLSSCERCCDPRTHGCCPSSRLHPALRPCAPLPPLGPPMVALPTRDFPLWPAMAVTLWDLLRPIYYSHPSEMWASTAFTQRTLIFLICV